MLTRTAAALAALVVLACPGTAHDFTAGTIEIGHPWSRPGRLRLPPRSRAVT